MAIDNQTKIDYFKEPLAGKTGYEAFRNNLTEILESHEENINQNISSIENLESSKIEKSIFTALNDFIVGTGVGTYVKKTPSEIRTILNVEEGATKEPTGSIAFMTHTTLPYGYLKANGAAISRTTYANLFALIGTTFGVGDGSTKFNLPDLRGEFIRGFDDGRGVDSGRVLGSSQTDAFQGHWHNLYMVQNSTTGGGIGDNTGAGATLRTDAVREAVSDGTNGTPRTSTETRPRNIALMAIIKY